MMKILPYLGIGLGILSISFETVAQSDIALGTKKAELQTLNKKLKNRDENDRRQVRELARSMGISVRRELPNGKVLELQRFSPDTGPVFYITNNVDAADTVSTDEVWPGGSAGLDLDGSGMTIGEWDAGAIAQHPDFGLRLFQIDSPENVSNHSTHVAGTLIGSGVGYPGTQGMAYAAYLDAYDWTSDTAEMASAASNNLLLSNHSYGIAAGWLYFEDGTWWWIGGNNDSDIEDANFGYYDSETQLWDQIAFDAPYYLIVKAAGNDRSDSGPAPGVEYTVIDQSGTFQFISTVPRNADCAPAGYDCLPTHSVAKNILTVGAVDDLPGGYLPLGGPSSVQMLDFSGWGPTDDGRIKPDVVGNGMLLLSTYDDSQYAYAMGTSMAAPNVTGSLLLLQQHYQNIHHNNSMRSATLKALAIHTADEAGDSNGPDYEYGWGLLNTKAAAQLISEDGGGTHQIIEGNLPNGATNTVQIDVSETEAIITATLVWTDPPGTPVTPRVLDAPNPMLVNDLDLRIRDSVSTYLPWVLNHESPVEAANRGDNFRDNVEQVVIDAGGSGSYSVEVSHKGTLLNSENQNYSLIISIAPRPSTNSSLLIDEDFSAGLPLGWSVETIKGISWSINTPIQGNYRLDNLTGGAGNFAMVDIDYSPSTITSLRTPIFDLSSAESVNLSFKSYFQFDGLETINVDISTDEGISWTNEWQLWGVVQAATYVLELSDVAAEQASVMLRFRFNSDISLCCGNLWQIDDVQLEVFGGTPPADTIAPVITLIGDNPVSIEQGSTYIDEGATAIDNIDGDLTAAIVSNSTVDTTTTGNYTVTYDVSDNAGNAAIPVVRTVNVTAPLSPPDTEAPSITAPADITVEATGVTTSVNLGSPTVSDNIDPSPTVTNDAPAAGFPVGTTTVTWTATDASGHSATDTQTVTITEPVQADTVHVSNLDGYVYSDDGKFWYAQVSITVQDSANINKDNVTVSGSWSDGSIGSCLTNEDGGTCSILSRKSRKESLAFTVTDLSNGVDNFDSSVNTVITINRTTPGADTTPPTITILGENPVSIEVGSTYADAGATANDNVDGDLTFNIQTVSTVDTGVAGTYTVNYNVSDSAGNAAEQVVRTVTVTDPGVPAALAAPTLSVSVSDYEVTLNWENTCSDCTYSLVRADKAVDRNNFSEISPEEYAGQSVIITESAGTYYYKVKAISGDIESDYSKVITVRLR